VHQISRNIATGAICLIALALSACAGERARSSSSSRINVAPHPPTPARSLTPAAFVNAIGSNDLFVERACELALNRAEGSRVRSLADNLLREHRGLSAQLSLSARRLNLLLPAALPPSLQVELDRLAGTTTFDTAFLQSMRARHQWAVNTLRGFTSNGSSPTLRQVGASALPVEQRHLQMLSQ
jgi:putative membrane protein